MVNVAAGTQGTDAVNVNQQNAVSNQFTQSLNTVNNQLTQMQRPIQQTDSMAREGSPRRPGWRRFRTWTAIRASRWGGGTATFQGRKAMAVGVQARITENLKATVNVGFAGSQRVVGAGMLYQWK